MSGKWRLETASLADEKQREAQAQVNGYQRGVEAGCKDQGRGKGDLPEKVDAVCECVLKVLKEEMPFADWQKAYFFSRSRNDREEMRVLAPHAKKAQVCRINAL